MEFIFSPITEEDLNVIISYRHGNDYKCFDKDKHELELDEAAAISDISIFSVKNGDQLVGFIEVTFEDDETMEMSGALFSGFRGTGMGYDYITQCIDYVIEYFDYTGNTIVTLIDNGDKGAKKVLERIGYREITENDDWVEMSLNI